MVGRYFSLSGTFCGFRRTEELHRLDGPVDGKLFQGSDRKRNIKNQNFFRDLTGKKEKKKERNQNSFRDLTVKEI